MECAHCGEIFDPEGKLVCPGCGADVDLTLSEPGGTGYDSAGDEDYEAFLASEGLSGKTKRGGRGAGCGAAFVAGGLGLLLLL